MAIMTRAEYAEYTATVERFFKEEGITNLSRVDGEVEEYFSWGRCDCCDRQLGGNRIDANGYNPITQEVQTYSICVDCEYYAEYGQLDDMTMLDIEADKDGGA